MTEQKIERATTVAIAGYHPEINYPNTSNDNLTATTRTELYLALEDLYKAGYRTFLCTLENGFGLLAAETVVFLRETQFHTPIRLVAVYFKDDPYAFDEETLVKFCAILRTADLNVELSKSRFLHRYTKRNRLLRECSSRIVCLSKGLHLGDISLVLGAWLRRVPVVNLRKAVSATMKR